MAHQLKKGWDGASLLPRHKAIILIGSPIMMLYSERSILSFNTNEELTSQSSAIGVRFKKLMKGRK